MATQDLPPNKGKAKATLSVSDEAEEDEQGIETIGGVIIKDLEKATPALLTRYVDEKAQYYKNDDKGKYLWFNYCQDFEDWTLELFKKAYAANVRKLRDSLREGGVWIPKDKTSVAKHLEDLLQRPDYAPWPIEEEEIKANTGGGSANPKDIESEVDINDDTLQKLSEKLSQLETNIIGMNQKNPGYSDSQAHGHPKPLHPLPPLIQNPLNPLPPLVQPQSMVNTLSIKNELAKYQTQNFSKEFTALGKLCEQEFKYSGKIDVFTFKFKVFLDNCSKAGVPQEGLSTAITFMLKDEALDFYHANVSSFSTMSIEDISTAFLSYFEGREHKIALTQAWEALTLQSIMNSHSDKAIGECLDILLHRLRTMQYGLDSNLQTESFLYVKLISACENISACDFACQKPSPTLPGLVSDLRASIGSYDRKQAKAGTTEAMYTDRKYFGQNRRGNDNRQYNGGKGYKSGPKSGSKFPFKSKGDGSCWICKKQGCRSINHTPEERQRYYQQLIADHEGQEEDTADSTDDTPKDTPNETTDEDEDEVFSTSLGDINGKDTVAKLSDMATMHAVTKTIPIRSKPTRYSDQYFYGIMIDTGAAFASSAGWAQYKALSHIQSVSLDTAAAKESFKFGIGSTKSLGTVSVDCPIGRISFHIIDADTPFLLSLCDLDKLGYFFNNLSNQLTSKSGQHIPVIRCFGHPFLVWQHSLAVHCCHLFINEDNSHSESQLTTSELRRLHRRFGHPSAARLCTLLSKSGHSFDREAITRLDEVCAQCQKHGKAPGRFKFSLKDEDIQFNYTVIIDIMYIGEPAAPVLHVVDEATSFQAARFLREISANHVWDALRLCWIDAYLGPPDMIIHDAGTQFTSKEFVAKATAMAITTDCVPIEAHHSIGKVERYHAPLRRAYEVIHGDLPALGKTSTLQMAVKAVNDTAGPNGLVPTLLVFGTFPKMTPSDPPHPSIYERGKTIAKAMKEITQIHTKRQVEDALKQRNGPDIGNTLDVPIGGKVLVFREKGQWTGPFVLLATDGQRCTVSLPSGPSVFRITSVKAFNEEDLSDEAPIVANEGNIPDRRELPARQRTLPTRFQNVTSKEQDSLQLAIQLRKDGVIRSWNAPFADSRKSELEGLLGLGVFKIVDPTTLSGRQRLFGCRFVDEIKYKDGQPYEKSRLVIQAHHDQGKKDILTQSPTIQRASQRIIVCLSMLLPMKLYTRDISQAYVQSTTNLARQLFVKPPKDVNLGDNILQVVRPLYGVPEAGTHWFKTYHTHHVQKLNLTVSTFDPCLMYSTEAVVGLQTDDTLFLANEMYVTMEEIQRNEAKYPAKPITALAMDKSLNFNGAVITQQTDCVTLSQLAQCKKISPVDITASDIKSPYIAQRARGAYIASMTQPEASYALSAAAQVINPKKDDAATLNKVLQWQLTNQSRGISYIKLNVEDLRFVIFVDAAFANNHDCSSQLGYVIVLANEVNDKDTGIIRLRGNIIHWSSTKCKRVTRSVLAAELYAMVSGFDIGTAIQSTINGVLSSKVPIVLCTDSYSVYDCLTKLGTTAEKRLMIDIMSLRQSYERREIDEVRWIDGSCNPADALTKAKPCGALKELIDTNALELKTKAWVERP